MKVEKKVISVREKPYSVAALPSQDRMRFLIGPERHGETTLFDESGNVLETASEGPGGVMTMVQVPGKENQFIAINEFYTPDDSKLARLVVTTKKDGIWETRTLADMPFVHRFGIFHRNGVNYILACALKSGHDHDDDWSHPGQAFAAVLPDDLSVFDSEHQLEMTCLKSGLTHNHGFNKYTSFDGVESAIFTCDEGVFIATPPEDEASEWTVSKIYDQPVSDAVLVDFDGDGKFELGCISPFHGDELYICKSDESGTFHKVWEYPEKLEFLHATWSCIIDGRPVWLVGHRYGNGDLFALYHDGNEFKTELIDHGIGSTNVTFFVDSSDRNAVVASGRETDTVAMYYVSLDNPAKDDPVYIYS